MPAPWSLRALAVFAAAFVLVGCPKRVESPLSALEDAAQDADDPDADARTKALGGFHAWLVAGDAKTAQARFDGALQKDASEPWALYGQHLLARRSGHPERSLDFAFQLLREAPEHPLSAASARTVLEFAGTSNTLDEAIIVRVREALAAKPSGDAAHLLRSVLANIYGQRIDGDAQTAVLTEMGVADAWTVAGPLSPFHVLAFDELTPPEQTGSLAGPFNGATGPITPRPLRFPDGRLSLQGEPQEGDMFIVASDFELDSGGEFVVRSVTNTAHKLYVDGTLLFERRSFERAHSTVSARGVELEPGRHRLLLKVSNDDSAGTLTVSVMRADGSAANLRFVPAEGAPAKWDGTAKPIDAPRTWPGAEAFFAALEGDAGPMLAAFAAIRDGMGRDADGAERLMAKLEGAGALSPAVLALRANLAMANRELPSRVSRARATRDLEAALAKDPLDVDALLLRAQFALNDGRQLEAAELAKRARAAMTPVGYPVPLLRAHIDRTMGIDAQAERSAEEALTLQPGLCEALSLRYDLARKRDAVALADSLVKTLEGCPGSRTRLAEHARTRGRLEDAITLYQGLLARDPSNLAVVQSLVALHISASRFDDATKLLVTTQSLWPRHADLYRRLGDVHDFAGRMKEAMAAREKALQLHGGDLSLRRSVHRAKTGKELLSEYAIDGAEAIRRYEEQPGTEEAASALVLDMAAVEAFEDGSMVDRIHVVQKALAQEGVSTIAEVNVPPGAVVLSLRTIKKDGTVLEPENIAGKDSISLPGVQVGDYVEYEFLQAHPPRGPVQPGFSAAIFYYQVAGVPNAWSTYVVVGPKDSGMTVDPHNVKSGPPSIEGDRAVYRHEELNVPPYIPEPNAPPSPNEYLPWVQLGAGARGNDGLVALYADAFHDRGKRSFEVERFAAAAVEGRQGAEAVRALHQAVMKKLQGRDAGLTYGAAWSLSQDRGSRLWALKAALEAVGIRTRVAAVRTFFADPAPYTFPNDNLIPYLALRAELPDGGHLWLDTVVRFGPFGQLPDAAGNADAWLLPEPGRPLEKVKTPASATGAAKRVSLEMTLAADGTLTGTGEERYTGFDAAQLTEYMDQLAPDQRKQAMQSALAQYFGGAEMDGLELDLVRDVGQELVVRYQFKVPGFARLAGDKWVLSPVTFPAQLGRRYVQLGSRTTPLFIDSTEHTVTRVKLKVPPGYTLSGGIAEARIGDDFGMFVRREKQLGEVVEIEEDYRLTMMRLPPSRYLPFARFAGQVDLLQARDLVLEKK